jgi:hypothetical protein
MPLDFTPDQLQLLTETLEEAEQDARDVLDVLIEKEQTAETVDEFLECTATQHERIEGLKKLQEMVKECLNR